MQRAVNVEVAITHTEVAAETVEPDHPLKDSSTEKRAKWKGVPFLTPEEEAENERLRELVQNMNRDYKVDPYPTLPAIEKRDLIGQGEPRPIKGWPGVMKLTYPDYVRLPTELERIAQSWKDANKHREKAQEILDLGATLITAEPIRPPSVYRTTPHRIGAGPPFQPPTTLRLR